MSYWGNGAADNDYAFDAVGAYVVLIKDRMLKDMATVVDKSYPEQSIVASLKCLRALAREFPKCVSVAFRRGDFEQVRAGFDRWFEAATPQLPSEFRDTIRAGAIAEFHFFEAEVLGEARA